MKIANLMLTTLLLAGILGLLFWLAYFPDHPTGPAASHAATASERIAPAPLLRLGLVPERDIFRQRDAYRALAAYLESHIILSRGNSTIAVPLPLKVELVTASTYAGILQDFQEKKIDVAILGSLVAILAVDRHDAQILLKSQSTTGSATYSGVIFVAANSPIKELADLRSKRLGAVRTTTAGAIYPVHLLKKLGLNTPDSPQLVWSGTHDDVIAEVLAGRLDAGAVKDSRLHAWERLHPNTPSFICLASSPRVPDNAVVIRSDLPSDLRNALLQTLSTMHEDSEAAPVLAGLDLQRFQPCELREYSPLYDMIEDLGPAWSQTQIEGPAPRRPRAATTAPEMH